MTHGGDHAFDKAYWEQHWQSRTGSPGAVGSSPPHPYLAAELGGLLPGTALDAGCGTGAETLWLAEHGWEVTAADISAEALARAAARAASSGSADRVQWVEADLSSWEPEVRFDLVTTSYAHPAMPQLAFYDRLATWVAPGGTLLVIGHLHTGEDGHGHDHGHDHGQDHGDQPPAEATATAYAVTARLADAEWDVQTADEVHRTVLAPHGGTVALQDFVVRATRRS
ncbi:class I SAM-dependent methyltransferase [Modestobacter sp. VKM Ac-2979]|uniref:class I SAM-dependent methyltransferase n=1 Tax=unclassified Modestobacter TaxID=2643866 RepID=UPI0022AB99B2|nr:MULTISPECIES: class I SAM-dependent methyltransferase [unclassified Modestobacter]MCZ2811921.1 class I SAM-dependent methyltransferase [Modestobacter sp. VKM Ac-2979]MCZ2843644.1 class I SAM-dependent methyltransferase [Modestobacter sp. VKM Ac-2980]